MKSQNIIAIIVIGVAALFAGVMFMAKSKSTSEEVKPQATISKTEIVQEINPIQENKSSHESEKVIYKDDGFDFGDAAIGYLVGNALLGGSRDNTVEKHYYHSEQTRTSSTGYAAPVKKTKVEKPVAKAKPKPVKRPKFLSKLKKAKPKAKKSSFFSSKPKRKIKFRFGKRRR